MKPKSNLDYRLAGVFLTLIGGAATYWQIVLPIFKALRGAESIDYSGKLGTIGSIALIMGLFMIVFGAEAGPFLEGKISKRALIFLAIGVIGYTLACLFGMEFILKSLGYY